MNSIIGALVGDAAGATLEGTHNITKEMVEHALTMPGGGSLNVGPGQITDDGELTLAIWNALNKQLPSTEYPHHLLIKAYSDWYNSYPFDMGGTCSQAFEFFSDLINDQTHITSDNILEIKRTIFELNKLSQANGALMRATAIATWIAPHLDCTAEMAAEFAMEDAQLSHPHRICQEANAIYVYTIVNLLRGISPKEALEYTTEFVNMNEFSTEIIQWFFIESLDISNMNPTKQIGHVRWGFVLAFYFLRNPLISYEDAIRMTLLKGGDTDTNACIVGGMVGTYQTIPSYMKDPVFKFDCTIQRHIRPIEYSVQKVIGMTKL